MKQIILSGTPSEKQKLLFASRCRYTAYGGARGGGKSWALRRKIILMCIHYPNLKCLLIRRSYGELRYNHILPILSELSGLVTYSELNKTVAFPNGSTVKLGYLSDDGDTLQYQGLEYDVIAIDEATQLTEYQFNILKACLRGNNSNPKRMYLTCNPGGVGHGWVKRLFVDKLYRDGERAEDYGFIQATVFDNTALLENDPGYVSQLQSLPKALREAWLYGSWDIFSGQFFPELADGGRTVYGFEMPDICRVTGGLDYGFDATALVLLCADPYGRLTVFREFIRSDLTLTAAARRIAEVCRGLRVDYIAASPDLWNRRQDSGISGYETMMVSSVCSQPVSIVYSDDSMPVTEMCENKKQLQKGLKLLNGNAAYRYDKCKLDALIRQALLDAAISGDGVFYCYWEPETKTNQPHTGDIRTVLIDNTDLFVSNVNSRDIQEQDYVMLAGRDTVEHLFSEALKNGVDRETAEKIRADDNEDICGDMYKTEAKDSEHATYLITFTRDGDGYIRWEKSTKNVVIAERKTKMRRYPIYDSVTGVNAEQSVELFGEKLYNDLVKSFSKAITNEKVKKADAETVQKLYDRFVNAGDEYHNQTYMKLKRELAYSNFPGFTADQLERAYKLYLNNN